MVVFRTAAFILFVCGALIAQGGGEDPRIGDDFPDHPEAEAGPVDEKPTGPTADELVEFLKADRNYWERLAMTNAAESMMLQSTAGKTWLANKELLKKESMDHTRATALVNAQCARLGPDFIFVRKSLTCEKQESAALAIARAAAGKSGEQ